MSFDVTGHSVSSSRSDRMAEPPPKRHRPANEVVFNQVATARGYVKSFAHYPASVWGDVLLFLDHVDEAVKLLLLEELATMQMKVVLTLKIFMEKEDPATGELVVKPFYFQSMAVVVLNGVDVHDVLMEAYEVIENKVCFGIVPLKLHTSVYRS